MTLLLKVHHFKQVAPQLVVWVNEPRIVAMNEVVLDNYRGAKTLVTDALVTCAAVSFYCDSPAFTTAFTHMSSASTPSDDLRKETILNEMFAYINKFHPASQIKMLVSPSSFKEPHLIDFLTTWAQSKGLVCQLLNPGGDSAVFNIDAEGNPLMIATSLCVNDEFSSHNKNRVMSRAHGVVHAISDEKLIPLFPTQNKLKHTFFNKSKKLTQAPMSEEKKLIISG